MPIPSIGYLATVPGAPRQTLPRSDWPLHSTVAALHSNTFFGPLAPSARKTLISWLESQDIPQSRVELWLEGLCGSRIPLMIPEPTTTSLDQESKYFLEPDPYQFYAAGQMTVAGGSEALGCGLGKTLTAEIIVSSVAPKLQGKPLILTSTKTALEGGAWNPYLPRFKKMGFSAVHVVSIDSLHKFEPGFPSSGGFLLMDEAHLLGGKDSRRTKHALKLRLKMDYGLNLTGTMFHGGVPRAMTLLNLAIPGLAAFANEYSAAAYFNCLQHLTIPGVGQVTKIVKPEGPDAVRFQEFVASRFVCSLAKTSGIVKTSVDIPDQTQHTVEFDGPWGTIKHDATTEIRRAIAAGEGIPHSASVTKRLARVGIESKIAWILDSLTTGEPQVIFAQYHESLNAIELALRDNGYDLVRVDGSVTGDSRASAISSFQRGEVPVFLGQIEAAGISVELTRAHRSVATDVSWRPDSYDQALARTCRRGQSHPCHHFDLVANRLQLRILETVRSGKAFDASITEYQDVSRARRELDLHTPGSLDL